MGSEVLRLDKVDLTQVGVVGGKAAHLGELLQVEGIRVPAGFCVTTAAFQRIVAAEPTIDAGLDHLSRLQVHDQEAIRALSAEVRRILEATPLPDELVAAIASAHAHLGEPGAYAVRSSATAEDLPTASFAGLQDTALDVVGLAAILEHIRRCWASLFTERAVTYRLRNGFHHRVLMAVIVQRMVHPQAAGVLFTADPVSGNRKVVSVEASLGLAEALLSGRADADLAKVRDGKVVAARSQNSAGQSAAPIAALTDAQIVEVATLGRRIEAHFGCPQDIEWCLVDDGFVIVQSRPITTLFPIPVVDDQENHVYVSVGHGQMMTDATPLSRWGCPCSS